MSEVRTFIALPLPAPILQELSQLQQQLAAALPEMRWVNPETVHLTLAFLGDIAEESLEQLGDSMLSIGGLHPPVEAVISGVGAFPSTARPRVVWVGLDGGDALQRLHAAVTAELVALNLPVEQRPFAPHLTLGRSRRPDPKAGHILQPFADVDFGSALLDRLIVYESRLGPQGARHIPRHRVPLSGPQP